MTSQVSCRDRDLHLGDGAQVEPPPPGVFLHRPAQQVVVEELVVVAVQRLPAGRLSPPGHTEFGQGEAAPEGVVRGKHPVGFKCSGRSGVCCSLCVVVGLRGPRDNR